MLQVGHFTVQHAWYHSRELRVIRWIVSHHQSLPLGPQCIKRARAIAGIYKGNYRERTIQRNLWKLKFIHAHVYHLDLEVYWNKWRNTKLCTDMVFILNTFLDNKLFIWWISRQVIPLKSFDHTIKTTCIQWTKHTDRTCHVPCHQLPLSGLCFLVGGSSDSLSSMGGSESKTCHTIIYMLTVPLSQNIEMKMFVLF